MTSMPASRKARAMIFAPRSCPSNPGLAITTRMRPPGTSAEYRGAPDRHRLVAGMAEPRERALRVHAAGGRVSRPPRLRAWRPRPPPRVHGVAGRRRHRDHALPPRPLGRPRAVGLGELLPRVTAGDAAPAALGAAGRRRVPRRARDSPGLPGHVRAYLRPVRVRTGHAFPLRKAGRHGHASSA